LIALGLLGQAKKTLNLAGQLETKGIPLDASPE